MENFNAWHWLDDQVLDAKKAAKNIPLIKNFTYFGTSIDVNDQIYYDLVIPTQAKDGFYWWRIFIKPILRAKRAENVSNIDLQVIMFDDDMHLPHTNQSRWEQIIDNENAVVNTIPYFDNWTEIFEQLSDILDRMIAKKEGTEMEESMSFKKAKQILENAGCRLVRTNMDESYETTADDYDFMYMKVLFNNYDFDYARSYGPNAAYERVLDSLREHEGDDAVMMVPSSYAEWEDVLGWSIGEEPPSDEWYK